MKVLPPSTTPQVRPGSSYTGANTVTHPAPHVSALPFTKSITICTRPPRGTWWGLSTSSIVLHPHVSWTNAGHCSPSANGGTEGGAPAHTHLPVKQLYFSSFHQDGDALPALQGGDSAPLIPHQDPVGAGVTTTVVLGKGVDVRRETQSFHPCPDQQTVVGAPRLLKGVLQEAAMTTCTCVCACVFMSQTTLTRLPSSAISHEQAPTVRQRKGLRGRREEEGRQRKVDTSACWSPTPPQSLLGQPQQGPTPSGMRHLADPSSSGVPWVAGQDCNQRPPDPATPAELPPLEGTGPRWGLHRKAAERDTLLANTSRRGCRCGVMGKTTHLEKLGAGLFLPHLGWCWVGHLPLWLTHSYTHTHTAHTYNTHLHTYTHIHIYINRHTFIYTQRHTHNIYTIHTFAHTYMHTCTHVHTYRHAFIYTQRHIYTHA